LGHDGFGKKDVQEKYQATLEALLKANDDFADPFRFSSSLLTELPFALRRQLVQDLLYALLILQITTAISGRSGGTPFSIKVEQILARSY
jgi:hypothetical protein